MKIINLYEVESVQYMKTDVKPFIFPFSLEFSPALAQNMVLPTRGFKAWLTNLINEKHPCVYF